VGFYRAYKTKEEAKQKAKLLRTPRGTSLHHYGYPVIVTIRRIKSFFRDGRSAWAVYVYKRK